MKKTTINHISNDLDEDNAKELLAYLQTYKRKCWGCNEKYKKLKKIKIIGNSITIICAGIAGGVSIITPIALGIATFSLVIQAYMSHKNITQNIAMCKHATTLYQHLLNEIYFSLRSGEINKEKLLQKMEFIDDQVSDLCPDINQELKKYDKINPL